jgi:hypothetical protein
MEIGEDAHPSHQLALLPSPPPPPYSSMVPGTQDLGGSEASPAFAVASTASSSYPPLCRLSLGPHDYSSPYVTPAPVTTSPSLTSPLSPSALSPDAAPFFLSGTSGGRGK